MNDKIWKFVGINFDHMHMGDLLRMVHEHSHAEIVGICDHDPARMAEAIQNFDIPAEQVFTDVDDCMDAAQPDIAILCPATGAHAEYVEKVAPYGVHVLVEKPFAATLYEADRMIEAMAKTGKEMLINWPLRWYPSHITTKRLIDDGVIGRVREVHFYDGNRGPLYHGADKIDQEPTAERKAESWFYKKEAGGGSLLDYLGYGVTLGTWFHDGNAPLEVTTMMDEPAGLEVDEHSVTIARYDVGLSKFETRWGTFTDPWTLQPQPKCGFVIVGTEGTISSYDYDATIRVQTRDDPAGHDLPVDQVQREVAEPVSYFIGCLNRGRSPEGPLSPATARVGQQIVDTAMESARLKKTIPLIK